MSDFAAEQRALEKRIRRSSGIWGAIGGLVVLGLTFWLAGGLGDLPRWGLALVLGAGAGWLSYRGLFSSWAARTKCTTCGTPFSLREVDRSERLVSAEPKRSSETVTPPGGTPRNKVATWTEQRFEVTAIDQCAKCNARTERKWTLTREADKTETEEAVAERAAVAPGGVAEERGRSPHAEATAPSRLASTVESEPPARAVPTPAAPVRQPPAHDAPPASPRDPGGPRQR